MTPPPTLHDALREVADRAPQPDLAERAISLAERRRHRRRVAVPLIAAFTAAATFVGGSLVVSPDDSRTIVGTEAAAVLPLDPADPVPWSPSITASAPARAAYVLPDATGTDAEVLVGVDGSARLLPPTGERHSSSAAALSPDGTSLAYAPVNQRLDEGVSTAAELRVLDLGSGAERSVALAHGGLGGWVSAVSWSPRGDQLVVSQMTVESRGGDERSGLTSSGGIELLLVDLAALEARQLAPDPGAVAWAPDGARIVTNADGAGERLAVIDVETGRRVRTLQLPTDADLDDGAWSPDGHELALLRRVGGVSSGEPASQWELVRLPLDGSEPKAVPIGRYVNPWVLGWRDGSPVLQVESGAGRAVLQSVDLATGRTTTLTSLPATGVAQVAVASELLASAPLQQVDADQAPWWSPSAIRWWFGQLGPIDVVLQLAFLLLLALAARGVVRRTRRALAERAARRQPPGDLVDGTAPR